MSLCLKSSSHVGKIMVLAATFSVCGCISFQHDRIESLDYPPQASGGYCSNSRPVPRMFFRATGFYSYGWNSADAYGYRSPLSMIEGLSANCGGGAGKPSSDAVDIYIVEENPSGLYLWTIGIPMLALTAATIGLLPIVTFRDYSACLEHRVDGSNPRIFFRRAHSTVVENLWGGINWKYRDGETQSRSRQERAINELALTLWNDFSVTGAGEVTDGRTCLERLDSDSTGGK